VKASVLLAHPYPKSFNHAIFNQICSSLDAAGIKTYSHDLYAEGFNPVLTMNELGLNKSEDPLVNQYADELMESDFLFFVHPNWWGQPPAMMKGYVDRVIRPPYAYDMPEGALSGLPIQKLKGKYGIVYTTSNTDAERETNYLGDPLNLIWQKGTFEFCGIEDYYRRMFRIVSESTEEVRKNWLSDVDLDVKRITGSR